MRTEPRNIQREILPNGLVVTTEQMPHVRSAAVGIWLASGSRREPTDRNGIAHFIEHMVFKGTERRSAEEIARSMDAIGGMLDAFTAKEMVCFSAKVLDEHLPIAFDVISDLVLRPRFAEDDIAKEKSVVLEEIKMDEDNPEYLVHETFAQNFWRGHSIGRPILGTRDSVSNFTRDSILSVFRSWYAPNHIVITAAGNLQHDRLVALASEAFSSLVPSTNGFRDSLPETHARITLRNKKELEQIHLCLGVPAYPVAHPGRFAASLLNNILGGAMSSRLFQNIRERQGLAYAVFSEMNSYSDTGMLLVYAGTARETAARVVECIVEEFRKLKVEPPTDEEIRRAKDHLKGSLMLSLESTGSRMANLARQQLYFGRFYDMDETIAAIESVSREDIHQAAQEFFRTEDIAATAVGNLESFELSRDQLAC